MLQQAVELDPGFAQAHAWLGLAYWAPSVWGFVPPAEAVARARPALKRALELDDTLSIPHTTAGWIARLFDGDWKHAEREFQRAIELNPGDAGAHNGLAAYYRHLGRFDESIPEAQECIDLDPLSLEWKSNLAGTYLQARRYEEAIAQYQKVFELDPVYLRALPDASWVYRALSRYDEAHELIERGIAFHGRLPALLLQLLVEHTSAGRVADAEAILAELHERDRDGYVSATTFAFSYALLGDMDEAFRWIDQAIENRDFLLSQPYWPGWELLRGDPRFLDMLRRINYPAIEDFETAMQNAASAETGQTPID